MFNTLYLSLNLIVIWLIINDRKEKIKSEEIAIDLKGMTNADDIVIDPMEHAKEAYGTTKENELDVKKMRSKEDYGK